MKLSRENANRISHCKSRIASVINSGVFDKDERRYQDPLKTSAFTELMICLDDLLQVCERTLKSPITFNDDVLYSDNVHTLISSFRGAVCHPGSGHNYFGGMKKNEQQGARMTMNMQYGKGKCLGFDSMENPYHDDIAIFYGRYRILLVRQIIRAFTEAIEITNNHLDKHSQLILVATYPRLVGWSGIDVEINENIGREVIPPSKRIF